MRRTAEQTPARARRAAIATGVAVTALLVVPLVPGALTAQRPAALVGLPAESIVVILVLLAVAYRPGRVIAAGAFGAFVVGAVVMAALDLGFRATIDRPFNVTEDGGALVDAYGVVADALGPVGAGTVVVLLAAVLAAGVVGLAAAALRVGALAQDRGANGRAAIAAVTGVWIVCAVAGVQTLPGAPVAASGSASALVDSSARAIASMQELERFDRALAIDPLEEAPPPGLLSALAGKDVVIAFVESYGRVALEPAAFTSGVDRALDEGAAALAAKGYAARSAFLTSPTFGGVSWLAHSSLQSGVWVDSPRKYARLLDGERLTLSSMFGAAGWSTMAVVPSNKREWEEGKRFYGYDEVLDSRNLGYHGPAFGYARMPDQYTWAAFHERLAESPGPVMAEVDLVSSHTPWTPLPEMVAWSQLGDGAVFGPQAAAGPTAAEAWSDPQRVRELYGRSVAYSLDATFSYLESFDQPDLVLVLLGDHQPARIVSGKDAGHDVPVTIIARDPAVFERIASWGWEEGVHPTAAAPVWRMDDFRDRFVDAFSG